jgi:hypothetical protein
MNVAKGYLDKAIVASCNSVRSTTRGAKMKPVVAVHNDHVAGLVCVRGELAKYAMKVLADAMSKVQQNRQRLVVLTVQARQPEADGETQRALELHRKTSLLLPLCSILPRYVQSLERDRAVRSGPKGGHTKKAGGGKYLAAYRGTKKQWSS